MWSLPYQFTRLPYRLLEVPLLFFFFCKQGTKKRSDISPPPILYPHSLFPSSFSSFYRFTAIIFPLTHSIFSDCWSLAPRHGMTQTPRNIIKLGTFWVSIVHSNVCHAWFNRTMILDNSLILSRSTNDIKFVTFRSFLSHTLIFLETSQASLLGHKDNSRKESDLSVCIFSSLFPYHALQATSTKFPTRNTRTNRDSLVWLCPVTRKENFLTVV